LADTNHDAIERVSKDFNTDTSNFHLMQCDITDQNQVRDLIQQADEFAANSTPAEQVGGIPSAATLLVNSAGITKDNWITQMELDEWDDVLEVNLKGTFLTCREFMNQKRADVLFPKGPADDVESGTSSHCSSIVNIGSIVSELGNIGQVNYAASKGGIMGLTRALAKEVAIRNIRVNAVIPGFIDTPMAQEVPSHVKERVINRIPMQRFGSPAEVANVISFLLSPRSGYITGESISVSGMISL
jgi:NAD(P)-dependent dehydrogenase (short-subunit alcohol dehydrogenase family)